MQSCAAAAYLWLQIQYRKQTYDTVNIGTKY